MLLLNVEFTLTGKYLYCFKQLAVVENILLPQPSHGWRSFSLFCFLTGSALNKPDSLGGKVPDPDENMPDGERRYQIYLKSPAGPIDVYVVSQARSRRCTTDPSRRNSTSSGCHGPLLILYTAVGRHPHPLNIHPISKPCHIFCLRTTYVGA